jgi:hypothetical protein
MSMEEWCVIEDFPNYSVSNLGNVKNNITNKLMKLTLKGGYYHLSLINDECKKSFKVHRLVALAFIDNPENKKTVNHKNKNKLDNSIENLEWASMKEQAQHKSIGLIYKSNKNKPIYRLDKISGEILQKYNSIEEAGEWSAKNKLTSNSHNGRNAIGNCINGLSNSAYGFRWKYEENESKINEEWREINLQKLFETETDFDKKYYVSNLGRFKNSCGTIMENYKVNENGYIRVYIYIKTFALHRLVALSFLENPENKKTVNHKDGNKLNNCVDNLEFATNKEQKIHKYQNGLANNFTRKIVQYDLEFNKIKEFNSIVEASKELNIGKAGINATCLYKQKQSGGYIFRYIEDVSFDKSEKVIINKNRGRNVGQYDLDMKLLKIHNSIADASRNLNIHKNNIWAVIKNNKKTSGGFIWKYLD